MTETPHFRQRCAATLAAALLLAPACAYTEDDDDEGGGPPIEELFKSELVFPQEQGEIQIASLPTYRDGPEGSSLEIPIGIEYGITDALQLEVEWSAYIDADADDPEESGSGQGNLQVGLMYSLIDIGGSGFHAAAGAEYEFASGDRRFLENGVREDSQELFLMFAKDLSDTADSLVFLQLGVELQSGGDDGASSDDDPADGGDDDEGPIDHNVWYANLGGYLPLGEAVLSLEFNLSEEEEERYVTPGISYQPDDGIELGVGVAFGLTEEADDYQVIAKLLWEFGD